MSVWTYKPKSKNPCKRPCGEIDIPSKTFCHNVYHIFCQFQGSLCEGQLTNPGASGSEFFLSNDGKCMMKTVIGDEAEFFMSIQGYLLVFLS